MKVENIFIVSLISIIIPGLLIGCSRKYEDVNKMDDVMNLKVTAHAGCMKTPEDSLESVIAGVQAKADICEVDVNLLGDGTPVLKHNEVQPEDMDLVRLSQVLEYIKDKNVELNLDIKDFNAVEQASFEASKYGVEDKVFFTGINEKSAEKLQARGSKIRYYLNHNLKNRMLVSSYDRYIEELIITMKKLGTIGINTDYHYCTEEAVEKIHNAGLLVSVWTVDDIGAMKRFSCMGVDNITTRHPDILINILSATGH